MVKQKQTTPNCSNQFQLTSSDKCRFAEAVGSAKSEGGRSSERAPQTEDIQRYGVPSQSLADCRHWKKAGQTERDAAGKIWARLTAGWLSKT